MSSETSNVIFEVTALEVSNPTVCLNVSFSYLNKHLAKRGADFIRGAVDRHGLPVSGKLQGKLFLHQLLDHLKIRVNTMINSPLSFKKIMNLVFYIIL